MLYRGEGAYMVPMRMAARLMQCTPSWLGRVMKHFGLKPVGHRQNGGQPEKLWSKVQILGVMAAPALVCAGASEEWADVFPRLLSAAYGDEQLEAVIALEGRKYLLVAGANVPPELLTLPDAEERLKQNKQTLTALRIPVRIIDIGPMYDDLMRAVRNARAAEQELA